MNEGNSLGTAAFVVRYVLPGVLVLAGFVCLFVVPSGTAFEAWALFTGAGLSVFLLNVLFRIGVQGERERDREDAARAYFDEHGVWPDEDLRPRGRQLRLPEGIDVPEPEPEQEPDKAPRHPRQQ
jgi:hypothetical protein